MRELWLHLYLNAFKNERSAFLRERVGGRGSAPPEDWGSDRRPHARRSATSDAEAVDDLLAGRSSSNAPGDEDETDARVPLAARDRARRGHQLDVVFDDKLPAVVERTGYRGHFHMVGQWFPKVARLEPDGTWAHFPFHHLAEFYADFGTYDVTLDVPSAYTIGATGPVVESRVAAGAASSATCSRDVHDFAWTAWDLLADARARRIDGVDVSVLYPPGFADVAARDLDAVRFALPYDVGALRALPVPRADGRAPAARRRRGRRAWSTRRSSRRRRRG